MSEGQRVDVPGDWEEPLAEDRHLPDNGGFASIRTEWLMGTIDTHDEVGEVSAGIGIGAGDVYLDIGIDGNERHVGVLARLSPEEARELARDLRIAAQVGEDDA